MRTNRPGQSALLLLDVVEALARERIDYLVIGAFALSAYGTVRASKDVDALLNAAPGRLTKLRPNLEKSGFLATVRQGDDDDPIPSMLVVSDTHGNQVDLLGGLRGLDPDAFSRAVEIDFLGTVLRFAGPEDLIAMKCFAGGPLDLADARSIYQSPGARMDLDLLRMATRRFGREAADRLEQVLAG